MITKKIRRGSKKDWEFILKQDENFMVTATKVISRNNAQAEVINLGRMESIANEDTHWKAIAVLYRLPLWMHQSRTTIY